jgi:hypothetical protein
MEIQRELAMGLSEYFDSPVKPIESENVPTTTLKKGELAYGAYLHWYGYFHFGKHHHRK